VTVSGNPDTPGILSITNVQQRIAEGIVACSATPVVVTNRPVGQRWRDPLRLTSG
jgi:hypothetical protein